MVTIQEEKKIAQHEGKKFLKALTNSEEISAASERKKKKD
jgi:hypothetical protein